MKRNTKRYLAMLLAMTLVLQQGGTITLADENEPTSEVVTEKTTEVQTAEKKEEKEPEETKEPENKAPETKPEAPKTEEEKAPEIKPEETNTPNTQTETQNNDTAAEPESGTEKATEQGTESEAVTGDSTTEGETQTPPEQEKESEKDSEPETKKEEEAKLDVSVMQEVFQKTVDDATVPMVRYTVKLANKAKEADTEDATLKVLLADALSYKKEEGETPELISFETLGKAVEEAALESEELNEEQKSAYANGNVVLWKDQTIAAGAEKTFVFCAEVKDGQTDVNALKNLWLVNGEAVAEEKLQWTNTDLLAAEEELPTEFTYEDDGMVVTATLAEGTVLPKGAQFVVEKVELSENEMAQVEAAAGEAKELANYVAYDMYFEVDGEEVEPQGEVAVKIAYKQANSTDFGGETLNSDAAEIQVIHLDEQAGAENVATGAEVGTDGAVSSAEFATDSFSVFVLSQMVDVDRSFLYEDDDVKITAVVGEDEEALNSNLAELKLEIIEDRESKEYKELEKAIEKKEKDNELLLGLRAYKFTFLKDGEEVEPTGEIEVKIEHKTSSIPEDVADVFVQKTSFYQVTKKGKVKKLDAEAKIGRNHEVDYAEMTIDGTIMAEVANRETTPMSREEILAGLGMARNFGIFAIDYYNTQDMEGCVAVKNLKLLDHQMGPSTNYFNSQTTVTLKIVKKAQKPGTYSFGIYVKNGEGYEKKASASISIGETDKDKTDDSWYEKSVTVDGKTLPSGEYYVFEEDSNGDPILEGGESTVNGELVTAIYGTSETTSSSGSTGILGVGASFIENFYGNGSNDRDTFKHETLPRSSLVIGKDNTISDVKPDGSTPNTGDKYIKGPEGAWYKVYVGDPSNPESPGVDIQRVEGTFPIDFEAEMDRLSAFSAKLANVAHSDNVKVLQIPVDASGNMINDQILINGEIDTSVTPFHSSGIKVENELLVVNVDCTNSPNLVNVEKMIVNGEDANGWKDVASNIIWNFYTTNSDGSIAPFTGTVSEVQNFGTVLAPKASFTSTGLMVGSIIVNELKSHGNEIHHKQLVEYEKTIERKVECTNTLKEKKGSLSVTKRVTGDAGDMTKPFNFTVTLSDKTINGTYGDMVFTNGVATFTLKHGETKTATGLPAGITYTVTETEANQDDYTTTVSGGTGTVEAGKTATAVFTNRKGESKGNLEVKKTVTGDGGDTNKEFSFTVTLGDMTINGTYGDMTFTNGVASFTLHHGETKKATGLPAGITYTVTETEANQGGYTTNATGTTGTIADGETATAAFENNKIRKGNLEVSKTVEGNASDPQKNFHFTVTLTDKTINGTYGGMTFTNGVASFTLKHGETKKANDLPVGTTGLGYTVTEAEANQGGYTTDATGATGTITDGNTATAAFVNKAFTTTLSLEAQKVMADGTKPDAGTYEFELTGYGLTEPVIASNDKDGKVNFGTFTYTQKNVGQTITYTVKEKLPAKADGTIYDKTIYTVTVTVSFDETKGVLKAEKEIKEGSATASAIEFTNDETHLSILKVDEDGSALAGARLVINGTDGKPVKDADGKVLSWTTDGKPHDITGLSQGDYVLSELEAPNGYDVAPDEKFTITDANNGEHPVVVKMTDKKTVPTPRSLRVTKELSMNDISPEAHIIVKSAIYHVALFEDEDRTKRVSDVKEIVFANQESSYATFENLEADKTYYVGETDEYGTLIPGGVLSPNLIYYPTYDGGATFKFEGETTEGLAGFTNVYVEWPDYLYLSGQLTVTKKVLLNGEPATSTDTFYARVFSDAGLTQPVSGILTLSMAGGSEASVLVTNLPVGDKPGDSRKYYVAETDANGTPLDPGAVTEYTISVDKSEVTLSGSHPSDTVVITNDFTEKESEFESEEIESESETEVAKQTAPKTGDDTDFMKYLLLMALSAGLGGIAVGQKRRKARRTRK